MHRYRTVRYCTVTALYVTAPLPLFAVTVLLLLLAVTVLLLLLAVTGLLLLLAVTARYCRYWLLTLLIQ